MLGGCLQTRRWSILWTTAATGSSASMKGTNSIFLIEIPSQVQRCQWSPIRSWSQICAGTSPQGSEAEVGSFLSG
ncbi:hypothetical protein C8R43DRAFT_976178 [Mycena crocata]|nr:hypothetical protein C8R43DRAFT_976178 [Mycena crocata]